MFLKLFILFVTIPLIELYLLIEIGTRFGAFHTVLLVVLTAMAGTFLARLEGLRTWFRIQAQLSAGQMPAEEIFDSLLIFMAGVLLITPGLLTDGVGLAILIPFSRFYIKRWLRRQLDQYIQKGGYRIRLDN